MGIKRYRAEVFGNGRYLLGEAPFYDERTKTISFVDIIDNKFYRLDENRELHCFDAGQPIGAAVPAEKEGMYLLAGADGLYSLEEGRMECVQDLRDIYETYQRSNDAKADPKGRLFFGSSVADDDHEPCGNLYRFDGTLQETGKDNVKILQPDTKISNGMAWSKDQKHFYFSDSLEHAVFSYDYDAVTGKITGRKVLFTVENGVPDGMCIDSEDRLWVAIWNGRRIESRSTEDGSLLAVIDVEAQNVTSCCFINDEGTLFITTSGNGQSGEYDGALFTCKVDAGRPKTDYARW